MKSLTVFKNEMFGEIRTLEVNGEPYFVGKDVAERLGYIKPNDAITSHIDEEDRIVFDKTQPQIGVEFNYKELGQRGGWIINESGLYSLILGSDLPNAKGFKRWVTSEVLPTIRKTGGYISNTDLMVNTYFGALDDTRKVLVKGLFENIEQQQRALIEKDKEITYLKPKATYCDEILKSEDTVTITQIAKDYGLSAIKLNSILNGMKIQFKSSGQWLLYSKYHDKGYTKSTTAEYDGRSGNKHSKIYTKWTQKGRMFLYEKLKENNIFPLVEVA